MKRFIVYFFNLSSYSLLCPDIFSQHPVLKHSIQCSSHRQMVTYVDPKIGYVFLKSCVVALELGRL